MRESDDGRAPEHPDPAGVPLQQVLDALVDPARRSIVRQMCDADDARAADISCGGFDLAVSKSTATHHFRVLREAGLIRQYYVGTSRKNALRRAEFGTAFPGLLDAVVDAERRARPECTPGRAG
ncbi:ArsR/SmtB family transcription factor [Yinghuangia seranimata]|uniref:ArsR/SmtB family transcription factor n=1 Tax=Yinghuangia seranimata TaxID=408067 RepID=UPI00248AB687|nr:ArsR family transcriptional regulator [Yinghuangia seranimata]MDI2129590.1 ArsR family transcriptional regulator [Yinghuangia seranimata]